MTPFGIVRWLGLATLLLHAHGAIAQPTAGAAVPTSQAESYRLPSHPLELPATQESVRAADPWLGPDKAIHAGASFLMTLSAQYVLTDKTGLSDSDALPLAAGSTLALGLAKEVLDSQRTIHPEFSWRDLAADALGVALAAALIRL